MPADRLRTPAASSEHGYTLVEMLVSLLILGAVAAMMVTGLQSSQMISARQVQRTERGRAIESAQAFLRARLESLKPIMRLDNEGQSIDMDGRAGNLVFLAAGTTADAGSAMRRYRVRLTDRHDLVVDSEGVSEGAPFSNRPRTTVLLSGVDQLQIGYLGANPEGGPPAWRSSWTRRATPPHLIRIVAMLRSPEAGVWPELLVRPAAEVDSLCTIDPGTGACRGRE